MPRIAPSTVQRILDTANIVDVVSDFVSLKRRGSGFIGLCPFHNERTPSFSVSPSRNFCKCFSCGKGGSPIGFLMELEKLGYQDALRWLAKKYNIEIEERELTDEERRAETERESMLAVNEWALKYFESTLTSTAEGRDVGLSYFRHRGLSDAMVQKFRLGYCTESHDAMYQAAIRAGYTEQFLLATGICARTDQGRVYDRFRARVIYPVFSVSGKVVAFGGRTLRSDKKMAKYVNSPESVIYSKSHELYGLYQARSAIQKADKVYLVEGYMDVISMFQSGVENVVASSGTSLTVGQIRLISRFTRNVTVIYDSDAAGVKASLRGIDLLLAEGLDVKVLQFPEGDDPDSFSQSHTSDELHRYLADNQVDFIRFKTAILLRGAEGDPIARARAITDICTSIAAIPDIIKRTVYITETSRLLSIDEQVIALQVAKLTAEGEEKRRQDEKREASRRDLNSFLAQEEQQQPQQPHQQAPAQQTPPSQQPSQPDNYLLPFEREVMRYIVRYGLVKLNIISDDGHPLTVLDFVRQEMTYDDIHFTDPAVQRTFDEVSRLAATQWEARRQAFAADLREKEAAWRREGEDDIRARIDTIVNLAAEEARLKDSLERRVHEAESDFNSSWLAGELLSHPDDGVRRLATELATDSYVLSNVHSRFTPLPTERDRLDELVERAIYEWKDAILTVNINDCNTAIAAAASCPDTAPQTLRDLLTQKQELLALKREFAKVLGERVISPRPRK